MFIGRRATITCPRVGSGSVVLFHGKFLIVGAIIIMAGNNDHANGNDNVYRC